MNGQGEEIINNLITHRGAVIKEAGLMMAQWSGFKLSPGISLHGLRVSLPSASWVATVSREGLVCVCECG